MNSLRNFEVVRENKTKTFYILQYNWNNIKTKQQNNPEDNATF